jgi:hypothetical protein
MAEVPKGYLIIDVLEASAVNKEGNYVWSSANFEAYVKGATHMCRRRACKASAQPGSSGIWGQMLVQAVQLAAQQTQQQQALDSSTTGVVLQSNCEAGRAM